MLKLNKGGKEIKLVYSSELLNLHINTYTYLCIHKLLLHSLNVKQYTKLLFSLPRINFCTMTKQKFNNIHIAS